MGKHLLSCWCTMLAQVLPVKMSDLFVKVKEKRDRTSNALNKSFCYTLTLSALFLMEEQIARCMHVCASWSGVRGKGRNFLFGEG